MAMAGVNTSAGHDFLLERAAVEWSRSLRPPDSTWPGPFGEALGEASDALPLALVSAAVLFVVQVLTIPVYSFVAPQFLRDVAEVARRKDRAAEGLKGDERAVAEASNDISVRTVAFAFSVFISYGSLRLVLTPPEEFAEAERFISSPPSVFYCAVAMGYFIWDLPITIYFRYGLGFFIHASLCFFIYTAALHPYYQMTAITFLLFELSTPFLNIRCIMIARGHTNNVIFHGANMCFSIIFIIVRVFYGIPKSYEFVTKVYADLLTHDSAIAKRHPGAILVAWVLVFINVALCTLNLYWAFQVVRSVIGGAKKKSKDS